VGSEDAALSDRLSSKCRRPATVDRGNYIHLLCSEQEMIMSDERFSALERPPAFLKPQITSYQEYLEIEDRVEVIDGFVYAMASPIDIHQDAVLEMGSQLRAQLKGKKCHPYIAPFDVRLPMKSLSKQGRPSSFTVVQPDLFILCDPAKNKSKYIEGAPDFIIEVLSDSTRSVDLVAKLYKNGAVGVREYWMLDPVTQTVMLAVLGDEGLYEAESVEAKGTVSLKTLEGLSINFDEVFPVAVS
jgi:Uma2 family endonuclease